MRERHGERYALMISKCYYHSGKKELVNFVYSDDLFFLFKKHDELWKQDHDSKVNYEHSDYYFEYEFFDYRACCYINRSKFIDFVNDTPITSVCRWARNGRKYVYEYITSNRLKALIRRFGVDQICDHTLWLQS